MAISTHNNQTHRYADNPQIQPGTEFHDTYPPIVHDGMWLRNKYTGEIVPNNEMYSSRSDILEPISDADANLAFGHTTNKTSKKKSTHADEQTVQSGEMDTL